MSESKTHSWKALNYNLKNASSIFVRVQDSILHCFQVNVFFLNPHKANFSIAVACRVVTTGNWKTVSLVLLVVFFVIFLELIWVEII